MKITIFTVDHLYANLVVKELVNKFPDEIQAVVVSGVILSNKSLLSSLIKYFTTSGLYYFLAQSIKLEIYSFLSRVVRDKRSKFYSFKNQLQENKITLFHEVNVNSTSFMNFLNRQKPDLIVSVFFNQILSPELLNLPKKGVINIHPAYLPNYKGVSPVFWALTNNEKYSGVSVHFIDKGIDTGGIIARKKILISKSDGEDSLYLRLAREGAGLLIRVINDIRKGRVTRINNSKGSYYSLPTSKAVRKFKKQGRNFFNLMEYIFN